MMVSSPGESIIVLRGGEVGCCAEESTSVATVVSCLGWGISTFFQIVWRGLNSLGGLGEGSYSSISFISPNSS